MFGERTPVVRQAEAAECGLACLAMIASRHGRKLSLTELRNHFSLSMKGATLRQLLNISAEMGLGSRAVKCALSELENLRLPAVLHWNLNHFVVLESVSNGKYTVIDPAYGHRKLTRKQMSDAFTGVAVEFSPSKNFERKSQSDKLSIFEVIPLSRQFWSAMSQALLLSLILQFFVLTAPLFMQFLIDYVLVRADVSLLLLLVIAFVMFKILDALSGLLRGLVLQYVSTIVSFDTESSVFHHMLRLPLRYFEKRQIGDIQQRFSSLQELQSLIVNTTIGTLIDGVLAIALGVALLLYNAELALVTWFAILIYLVLKTVTLRVSQKLTMGTMLAAADKQSHFLETLRAIHVIKTNGIEASRELRWRNYAAETLNEKVKLGNVNIAIQALQNLIFGMSFLLVAYMGARQVLFTDFTIGMLVAFIAFKQQLETRLTSLIDAYTGFKLLDVNLERVSDILMAEKEEESFGSHHRKVEGNITLRHVTFAFANTEAPVLIDVNLQIKRGEFVAITGPSGAGKSTLLKMIAGLLEPSDGEIHYDEIPMSRIGGDALRRSVGCVLQHDTLLTGTIEQNIALFDANIEDESVRRAARLAAIEAEIDAMPMGFLSLVGDMGSTLSGGQQQRVLIARALYRNPRILILDEATSQLDAENERQINDALRSLQITRIVAAHRLETLLNADRIYDVRNGLVTEISPSDSMSITINGLR